MDEFVSEGKMRDGEHSVKAHRFAGFHGGEECCRVPLAIVTHRCVSLAQHPWCLGFAWGPQVSRKLLPTESAFVHCGTMLPINSSREEKGDLGSHLGRFQVPWLADSVAFRPVTGISRWKCRGERLTSQQQSKERARQVWRQDLSVRATPQ